MHFFLSQEIVGIIDEKMERKESHKKQWKKLLRRDKTTEHTTQITGKFNRDAKRKCKQNDNAFSILNCIISIWISFTRCRRVLFFIILFSRHIEQFNLFWLDIGFECDFFLSQQRFFCDAPFFTEQCAYLFFFRFVCIAQRKSRMHTHKRTICVFVSRRMNK